MIQNSSPGGEAVRRGSPQYQIFTNGRRRKNRFEAWIRKADGDIHLGVRSDSMRLAEADEYLQAQDARPLLYQP